MEIAIIGGGASGLMAALAARSEGCSVTIYERCKRVGRKLLATGNGRCNMTNTGACIDNYYGHDPGFIIPALKRFWVRETMEYFGSLGILCKTEQGGKVYPYSDTASSVLDVLRREAAVTGVKTVCDFDVCSAKRTRNGSGKEFTLKSYSGQTAAADRLIIAAGGKAAPDLGSNGSGYELLRSFGHSITELRPSLVQLKTEGDTAKKLKGIKLNAKLTAAGRIESGELLFTDYGISGPPVFSLSARVTPGDTVSADIMPEYSKEQVEDMLFERAAYLYNTPIEEFFTGMLNKRVGQTILKQCGCSPLSRTAAELSPEEIKRIAESIKRWRFRITGTMSWNNAQVTKGGALTDEFDPHTMQSKLVAGLYACGEILDIDGDCGGYNLQWAWSSGRIAGLCAAQ